MSSSAAADSLLVCPACRSALAAGSASHLACTGCGLHYPIGDGIPNLLAPQAEPGRDAALARSAVEREAIRHFEEKYSTDAEPWDYTSRAGEVLRHDYTRDLAAQLKPSYRRILDLGCSMGQLTGRMYGLAPEIHGIDVSPIAVQRAREHCRRVAQRPASSAAAVEHSEYRFCIGSAVDVPVREGSCDLILVCDGLRSWQLDHAERRAILARVNRALAPDGYAILTDYLKSDGFDEFQGWIAGSPLQVVYTEYLPDRQWYQFASWFKAVRGVAPVRRMLASTRVARAIMAGSRRLGRLGAAHLCVVATRGPLADGA
jgi:SAM-dependent methyltransferase/uncharacterized protein YbaR (Trm112 family)